MYEPSSAVEAAAASVAISAGVPARPSGIMGAITSMPGKSPVPNGMPDHGRVYVRLGAIVLAVIPLRASSTASARVSEMTPPLDAE